MPTRSIALLFVIGLLTACTSGNSAQPPIPVASETSTSLVVPEAETAQTTPTFLEGTAPSKKVAAFYYPWYGNPTFDNQWIHWTQGNHLPPDDISSDYYPALGTYSSNDPAVAAQHMKWLRQAGIGVIISSWWGPGSREDQAVPLLLETAEQYGIEVAFHIEPYKGRSAESLVRDIGYLYENYGGSPAFFRSLATSRYSPNSRPKGMFFVWSIGVKGTEKEPVQAEYWRAAMDAIHTHPQGALVIAHSTRGSWIDGGHFDGLYNYATLHLEEEGGFEWARSLPPDSMYVPSVLPGFSARRVGYSESTYVTRHDGKTYQEQWAAALETGIQPELVTVTSFNEWHEGSHIEPARAASGDGNGYTYADFGPLPPEAYLDLTRAWVDRYLAMRWPATYRTRIRIITTSDWTTLDILGGGAWIRPEFASATASATAGVEAGDRFVLKQSLEDASAGKEVEMTWDVLLTNLVPGGNFLLQIDRGNLGRTRVLIYASRGDTLVEVKTFEWDQVTTGRNSFQIAIPSDLLIDPNL